MAGHSAFSVASLQSFVEFGGERKPKQTLLSKKFPVINADSAHLPVCKCNDLLALAFQPTYKWNTIKLTTYYLTIITHCQVFYESKNVTVSVTAYFFVLRYDVKGRNDGGLLVPQHWGCQEGNITAKQSFSYWLPATTAGIFKELQEYKWSMAWQRLWLRIPSCTWSNHLLCKAPVKGWTAI